MQMAVGYYEFLFLVEPKVLSRRTTWITLQLNESSPSILAFLFGLFLRWKWFDKPIWREFHCRESKQIAPNLLFEVWKFRKKDKMKLNGTQKSVFPKRDQMEFVTLTLTYLRWGCNGVIGNEPILHSQGRITFYKKRSTKKQKNL